VKEYRTYWVLLNVECETCGETASFEGTTRQDARTRARSSGWSLPGNLFAYCPMHAVKPPCVNLERKP